MVHWIRKKPQCELNNIFTLVNVYVDLLVFARIAGTSQTGSGRYWCKYYIEKHAICLKDYIEIDHF